LLFIGYSALGSNKADIVTPTIIDNITKITIQNGIFNDMIITKDTSQDLIAPISTSWDWNTIIHAEFNDSLLAGNTDFSISQISKIRVKYREVGLVKWISLTDVPIVSVNDLSFERYSKYFKGGKTNYQVALVPISASGGIEGNYNVNTVISDFNDLFVVEKDNTYHGINVEITPTRNKSSATLIPLDSKYPVLIYNTKSNYDTLSIKGMFIQLVNGEFDKVGAWKYRNNMKDTLYDNMPKIIKYSDGRMWLCGINDNIPEDSSQYNAEGYTIMSFAMTEIGDSEDSETLYLNGFTDIDTEYGY